jgi:chromosomal replication initiation ATPase DnaA
MNIIASHLQRSLSIAMRARLAESAVSTIAGIAVKTIRQRSRGRAPVAQARASAMYLTHVSFGISLTATGRAFGRDRTTVRHACARIELMRDDRDTEFSLSALEAGLQALARHLSSERNGP